MGPPTMGHLRDITRLQEYLLFFPQAHVLPGCMVVAKHSEKVSVAGHQQYYLRLSLPMDNPLPQKRCSQ